MNTVPQIEAVVVDDDDDNDEEQDVTQKLEESRSQLLLITTQCNFEPTNQDYAQLKSHLEELVKLLEDELLKIKKAKLLAALDLEAQDEPDVVVGALRASQDEDVPEKVDVDGNNDDHDEEDDESPIDLIHEFNGLECSVPYQLQNGKIEFHDAILQVDDDEDDKSQRLDGSTLDKVRFKAYFLYPTMWTMVTCQYYLRNSCKFSSVTCRYSHGVEVNLEQIRSKRSISFEENECSDLTRFQDRGQVKCLVQGGTSLWRQAVICRVDASKGEEPVLVRHDDDGSETWLGLDRLVILESVDGEEEVERDDDGDHQQDHGVELESVVMLDDGPIVPEQSSANHFGDWERYTKGIGSKLLTKMGYRPGRGLGVHGEGIVEPIEPLVFPPGRSLDHCIALKREHDRKKTDLKTVLKEKVKRLRREAKLAAGYAREDRRVCSKKSVFEFLNHQIFGSLDRKSQPEPSSSSSSSSASHRGKEFAHINAKTDDKSLNVSSFQVGEELRKARHELRKLEDSYRRMVGEAVRCDATVVKHVEQKLRNQRERVAYLQRKESAIGREKQIRSDKNKLRFF